MIINIFHRFAHSLERYYDLIRFKIKKSLNLFDPIIIFPYRGYANQNKLIIKGRVLEKEGILGEKEEPKTLWEKLHYMFKRYESDEMPGITMKARLNSDEKIIKTDEEGYFNVEWDISESTFKEKKHWQYVDFEVDNNPYTNQKNLKAKGEILRPMTDETNFIVISDVDDTIIKSHANDNYLKIKTLLVNTASTRVPFPGVTEFYNALQNQKDVFNPIFFVSGSSWNIYDLLTRFCEINNIPKAPFFLRELGIDKNTFIQLGTKRFKKERINHLLDFYKELPFILIGDSGQKDSEIYFDIARNHPDRIKAIYIRNIDKKKISDKRKQIIDDLKQINIDMLLVSNTYEAAAHAAENGLIGAEQLEKIKQAVN